MKDRLVRTGIHILCLLYGNSIGVNQIILQTSSDRAYVINILRNLTKANLVIEERDSSHKQKRIKKLTLLGEQLAQLMNAIEQYRSSYINLRKTVTDSVIVEESNENILANKLRSKGWEKEDIDRYPLYVIDSYWFLFNSYVNMISALTIRKATILSKFKVDKTASIILDEIISGAISHQISVMLEYIDNIRIKSNSNVKPSTEMHYLPSPEDFSSVLAGNLIYNNKFIDRQAMEVLFTLFSVLNPSSSYIEQELKRLKLPSNGDQLKIANKLKKFQKEERKRDNSVYMKKSKDQAALYEQLLGKKRI